MNPTRDEIPFRLPHGPEFRFLNSVTELDKGVRATGVWRVAGHEPFFRAHFPENPLVPGALLAEALAQLSGVVGIGSGEARLAHADVRFDAPITPPADITLRSTLTRRFGALVQFDVEAWVGETRAARGTITLAVNSPPDGERGAR